MNCSNILAINLEYVYIISLLVEKQTNKIIDSILSKVSTKISKSNSIY